MKHHPDLLSAEQHGLYQPTNEHDACGVGFIAHLKGEKRHDIIDKALQILVNLEHRGAVGADPLMGDGAGILVQIPDAFFREEMAQQGINLPPPGEYGVGMVFLPQEPASRLACERELERMVRAEKQVVLGWRDVPVNRQMPMSPAVKDREPYIRQLFVGRGQDIRVTDALERKLYIIRKSAAHSIMKLKLKHGKEYFVPSMSARTIVYKGLLLADQVGQYYLDLQNPQLVSAMALVHQRFSTNTFPSWSLAHPYRMIAHNGEINTVKGNFNWVRAREAVMNSPMLGDDLHKLWPLIYDGQSDTACFDNCLELLVMSGYSPAHAMMMMIPEAWEHHTLMDEHRRAFYEYHAAMMEPWDGPASIAFTDGRQIGATLDRNGLRPARYCLTEDNWVVMASESGVLPIPESSIVKKWRLQPGKMFLVDLEAGRVIDDAELKETLAKAKPYREWINRIRVKLDDLPAGVLPNSAQSSTQRAGDHLIRQQQAFGYTQEDLKFLLAPMIQNGEEAIGSMGNDSALPVLSQHNKPFYHYFKQIFAQVTNPPIDPIREQLVMSLVSFIGPRPNLLDLYGINPPSRLEVNQPILNREDMEKIRQVESLSSGRFKSHTLNICYPQSWGSAGIEAFLASLGAEAEDAVKSGANILILSDRTMNADWVAVPALLATSALHQHLIARGQRANTGLVVETGSAREVHHFALLAGFGAEAIHPYLALDTIDSLYAGLSGQLSAEKAQKNFIKALGKGLMKVFSKMGISTYMSYCGAQIFEPVGLNQTFLDQYFRGLKSKIGGIGVFEVAEEALRQHHLAFAKTPNTLENGGEYAYRTDGEEHLWTPDSIAKLQHAVRANRADTYAQYAQLINDQSKKAKTLRGLFCFKTSQAIDLAEVESAREIVKRFSTGAMSLGSISTEAHTTLAVAMNRLGGKSNTGEGGEDALRYAREMRGEKIGEGQTLASILGKDRVEVDYPLLAGDSLRSKIKQVASGRFGVTAAYLASADELQIKMAQGAKPGEGGQLPGHKVTEYIAQLRFSVPGVGLISPPPHHDIYSIEDLAQLIHDLKNANPRAAISVKLVSENGVGTIAAGVAKCKADHITIAGHDGGTGASPLSSIKHAGTPWELGLAETQQILVLNRLRGRVRLQVDGQLKTGRDVVIGALLGADEFGFATAPLVAQGCIMMRKCHLNTCPVGVATQDPILRKRFAGKPEHVVNYFFFIAEEVRQIMASLGVRKFEELIGRSDLLDMRAGIDHWKSQHLDFSKIFYQPDPHFSTAHRAHESQDHGLEKALDRALIEECQPLFIALQKGKPVTAIQKKWKIRNRHRSVGAQLSGEIGRLFGHDGLPPQAVQFAFEGSAGQSFGAFLTRGVTFRLIGDANDYLGKGLSGGTIVVAPDPQFRGDPRENIIVGNTSLYGATEGQVFLSGVAGERFAVRNSGAIAVVEGLGDHGCEYMTGGAVVVLGKTGRNFAGGMSGGVAFVYDEDGQFNKRCNTEMVQLLPLSDDQPSAIAHINDPRVKHLGYADESLVREWLSCHQRETNSEIAAYILKNWATEKKRFVKVLPFEYQRALHQIFGLATATKTPSA